MFDNPVRKIPVVYDASYYGYDLHLPLVDPRITGVQTFTYSASATVFGTNTRLFTPSGTTQVSYTPLMHSLDSVLSNLDTGVIYHEGNNTAFDQDYMLPMPTTSTLDHIQVSAAFILNVSNWVDGAAILNYVQFQVASYQARTSPLLPVQTVIFRPENVFTALSANGAHLFIVRGAISIPAEARNHAAYTLNIQINVSGTSANDTYQIGIVDMYPTVKSSAAKRLFPSELIAHLEPTPEHLEEIQPFTTYELGGTGVRKF